MPKSLSLAYAYLPVSRGLSYAHLSLSSLRTQHARCTLYFADICSLLGLLLVFVLVYLASGNVNKAVLHYAWWDMLAYRHARQKIAQVTPGWMSLVHDLRLRPTSNALWLAKLMNCRELGLSDRVIKETPEDLRLIFRSQWDP